MQFYRQVRLKLKAANGKQGLKQLTEMLFTKRNQNKLCNETAAEGSRKYIYNKLQHMVVFRHIIVLFRIQPSDTHTFRQYPISYSVQLLVHSLVNWIWVSELLSKSCKNNYHIQNLDPILPEISDFKFLFIGIWNKI